MQTKQAEKASTVRNQNANDSIEHIMTAIYDLQFYYALLTVVSKIRKRLLTLN